MRKNVEVLNLVISGIPSIQVEYYMTSLKLSRCSFKPCYKWNTFNTEYNNYS